GVIPYLGPDGKTQVTIRYENDRPVEVAKVLISTQHREGIDGETLIKHDLWEHVVEPVLHTEYKELFTEQGLLENFLVNPTGKFVIGGPVGDAGVTGRKIIVDTYGGAARHGGGAFSGKDPSKVDRSAAYAARYVAKNAVAAGLADRCEIQVAYAIGVAHPVSVMVQTFGTGKLGDSEIARLIQENFDLRPAAFRRYLDLHRPIFQKTAAYGHFGREDADFTWERTDRTEQLRAAAGLGAKAEAPASERASVSPEAGDGAGGRGTQRRSGRGSRRPCPSLGSEVVPIAKVEPLLTTRSVSGPFDYRVPEGMSNIEVGSVLVVPFGRRRVVGVVVGLADRSDLPEGRLAEPLEALEAGVPAELVELGRWGGGGYCSTPAPGLGRVLPPGGG